MQPMHKWMTNQKTQCMVPAINKDGTAKRRNASVNEAVEIGKSRMPSSHRGLSLGRENPYRRGKRCRRRMDWEVFLSVGFMGWHAELESRASALLFYLYLQDDTPALAAFHHRDEKHRSTNGGYRSSAEALILSINRKGQIMSIPGKGGNDRIEEIILPNVRDLGGFKVRRALPSAQRRMVGPFIFFDQMGPVMFGAGEAEDVRPASAHRPVDADLPVRRRNDPSRQRRSQGDDPSRRGQLDDGRKRHRPFRTFPRGRARRRREPVRHPDLGGAAQGKRGDRPSLQPS